MAYPAGNTSFNQQASELKRTKIKESKNGAEYNYCYVEIKGQLYRINVSEAHKEKRNDSDGDYWVKVTKCEKRSGTAGGQRKSSL